MDVTQKYRCASQATTTEDGLAMHMAAEIGGPPVRLNAEIANSAAYAQCMLALFEVVTSDLRTPQQDHSDYQAWVRERYLEALPAYTQAKAGDLDTLTTPGKARAK